MADSLDRARDELPDDGYHRGNRLGHGVLPSLPPHPSSLYLHCFRSFNRDQSLDTIMSHIPGNMRETCFFVPRTLYSYENGMQQQGRVDEVIATAKFMNVER